LTNKILSRTFKFLNFIELKKLVKQKCHLEICKQLISNIQIFNLKKNKYLKK
jgi:hypothetical protein